MNYILEISIAVFASICSPIIVYYVKSRLESKKKKILIESIKISDAIQEKIEDIRKNLNANRVWVNQFHNGGNFYPTGKSIQKFSVTYEAASSTKYNMQMQFQNIPISLFAKLFKSLTNENKVKIYNFDDGTVDKYGLETLSEQTGAKSSYIFAINTFNDQFIGCLGVDFCEECTILPPETIDDLMLEATLLGGVMKEYLKNV